MSNGKNQHIVPISDGKWGIRGENNKRITKKYNTQKEAIKKGVDICKNQKIGTVDTWKRW
jgi:undecaprenyl pyrophosphate synthase